MAAAAAERTRAVRRGTYVTPVADADAEFRALKRAWEQALASRHDDLPCGKCTVYSLAQVLLTVNAACETQDVALLGVSAHFHEKGSANQQSIAFWSIDLVRAYGERKKVMSLDNCKVTNALKSTMKGAFRGASIDQSGHGASVYACATGYTVLPGRPVGRPDPAVKRIPTRDGWVYVRLDAEELSNPIQDTHWVFNLMYDRAFCPTCQAGV